MSIKDLTIDDIRAAAGQIRVRQDEKKATEVLGVSQDEKRASHLQSAQDRIANLKGMGSLVHPLLEASGWRGEDRHLFEALPHLSDIDDIDSLRTLLSKINIETLHREVPLDQLNKSMMPCILVFAPTHCGVVVDRKGDDLLVFDSKKRDYVIYSVNAMEYEVYMLSETNTEAQNRDLQKLGWVTSLVVKFRSIVRQLMLVSFITSFIGILTPLYVMNIYDKAIGARSLDTLYYLVFAALAVIATDIALRVIRSRAISYLGARFETLLGTMAYRQIVFLPLEMTEKSAVGDQLTRLKQFEGMKDLFTGPLANALLDLPFTLVFLAVILLFGGPVAWIPVCMILAFASLGMIVVPMTRFAVRKSSEIRNRKQQFMMEMLANQESIKAECAENVWMDRYRNLSQEASLQNAKSSKLAMLVQNFSSFFMMASGIATLTYATVLVMEGEISVGVLIALMSLVWKVLAPIQSIFTNFTKFEQTLQSAAQVNNLMKMRLERQPGQLSSILRKFSGQLSFKRVSFRYSSAGEPALVGFNLEVEPGEVIVITGQSGSGKSTVLKLIAGLYQAQSGVISLDGLDSRQIDKGELRHTLSYLPQESYFFFGTIEQNIRLNEPTATDEDVAQAILDAGIVNEMLSLPEGKETRLTAKTKAGFSESLKQRLSLARAFVKDCSIYLLDEPGNHLDKEQDDALIQKINAMRGVQTVVMTSHKPSHFKIADRILVLKEGQIVAEGTPEEIIPKLES